MSRKVKIVLAGQSGVGKSSIVSCFNRSDSSEILPTIGCALHHKNITRGSNEINIDIWDTAGQERYLSLGGYYFRNCNYCILVFALNDLESFSLIDTWKIMCQNSSPKTIYYLVGNKLDIQSPSVTQDQISKYCRSSDITHYFETSADTGEGISQLLDSLVDHTFTRITYLPEGKPLPQEIISTCTC